MDTLSLFDLSGQVAVVTGGAGLLGTEFCRTLSEAGAGVVIADTDRSAAEKLVTSLTDEGAHALYINTDVTDPASVSGMVSTTLEAFGRLDILVNSAALDPKFDLAHGRHTNAFESYPLEAWRRALDVNLTGAFLCAQAASRAMLEQGSGAIVNVSSIYGISAPDQRMYQRAGQEPQYKPVYYTVTKAGLDGLTRYLAAYFAGKNIRVNTLTPGGVFNDHDDEFVRRYSARAVLGRMAEKDEMNAALLFLVSEASRYMTGANLVVDGGWTTW